jgi:hypothetical protein
MAKRAGGLNYGSNLPKDTSNDEQSNIINDKKNIGWDFSKITIQQLGDELNETINLGTPIFLWSKERLNHKIQLDNEKQVLIFTKIQNLISISKVYCELMADAIFTSEFIENLNAEKRLMAEQSYQVAVANHKYLLTSIKSDIDLTSTKIYHDQVELDKKRAENESIRADTAIKIANAKRIEAEVRESEKKIEIIEKLLNEADFNNLTTHQTFLLHTFLGADPNQFSEFQIREELKVILKQEKQAEADKKSAEADRVKKENEANEWKFGRDKKAAEKNDNR